MKKSKKWSLIAGTFVVLAVAAAWGFSTLRGASSALDPSRLATVERATMTRSVVATGKVEPITKVEIKSKANGIIERLFVDVDQVVMPGQVLAELDKENLTARVREARANLQAAEAARAAAAAQLKKNEVEAEAPLQTPIGGGVTGPAAQPLDPQVALGVHARPLGPQGSCELRRRRGILALEAEIATERPTIEPDRQPAGAEFRLVHP